MGGNFDADTQQTVTQYFFTVPSEDLDVALHIEELRMRGVLDTDELWDQERGAIEQEVAQDLSNPQYVFYTKLLTAMFRGTPYENDALGSRPSFDKTTGAMLHRFLRHVVRAEQRDHGDCGRCRSAADSCEDQDALWRHPGEDNSRRGHACSWQRIDADAATMKTDLPYGLAVISFRLPGSDSPDFAAANMLGDVLSSQRGTLVRAGAGRARRSTPAFR